jgi:heterodisulfide reductase subunit A
MKNRIGVFLCDCGENIGGVIDLDALEMELEQRGEVAFVARHNLLCSPDGKQFFIDRMKEGEATHAVVAACSPKDHESDFQGCLEQVDINKFLLQMANVREHCTWVTGGDAEGAERKSRAMIAAAVKRVVLHEGLEEKEIECCPDVIVIGGGLAGIEAALLAAQGDRKVTLIESAPSIGGRLPEYEEVAPTMECAPCMISPRLSALDEHPGVEILTHAEVTRILGYLGNFEVQLTRRARRVNPDLCIGCDECMSVCPREVDAELDRGLGMRKAIYVPFPGSVPNCAVIDRAACLRDQGTECNACAAACPMEAVDFEEEDDNLELRAGAIVLATGFDQFDPSSIPFLGYGQYPDVYTLAEFERLTASNGPTGGKVVKRDGVPPESIAFIHCVGRGTLGYCSGLCCQAALKSGILAGREAKVVHLHTDLTVAGPAGAALHRKAEEKGAELIRISDTEAVSVLLEGGKYTVNCGEIPSLRVDMVVLVTGAVPGRSTETLAGMLDLARDPAGFLSADHPVLRPAQASLDGVFIAGCAAGPKTTTASIVQGQAAAGGALARLQPGRKIKLQPIVAHADEDLCSGCLICISVCPYKAGALNEETRRAEVNEVLCQGCGTCVATCPSGAASARHFTDEQISAEIKEVLHV